MLAWPGWVGAPSGTPANPSGSVTTYRVLLSHPLEPRLLMLQTHGEWRLPHWDDSNAHDWQATEHVNRAVAARFGAETTVLRCARDHVDPVTGAHERVYELENHSAAHDMPLAATWISMSDLPQLRIESTELRELVHDWFARSTRALPGRGAAWTQPGWYVQALAWAAAQLREQGLTVERTPEQLRAWERAFVMRLRSDGGSFLFRAVPPVFRHAPALAQWLHAQFPQSMPELIAADVQRGWYLQRELEGVIMPLEEAREETLWEDAARRLAEIQVATIARTEELAGLGVPMRTLDVLAYRLTKVLHDAPAMLLGHGCGLTRPQIERVALYESRLLECCDELAGLPIPHALEHGDLLAKNVLVTLEGPLFQDWAAASISHPFFSLFHLLADATSLVAETSLESRRRLRDVYLEPWREFASRAELVRAFDLARILAPVHLAAIAHAEIIPATGWRWEVECVVPENLRTALEQLEETEVEA